jgi:hypothetical protein
MLYIHKYWGNYIGNTDDSLNLLLVLEDQPHKTVTLGNILAEIGLDKLKGDYRQTATPLEYTHSDGLVIDFHFAIDVMTDLAALLLEMKVNGELDLRDLDGEDAPAQVIELTATVEENALINRTLLDFAAHPLEYDLHELVPVEDMQEMAQLCDELRQELYG